MALPIPIWSIIAMIGLLIQLICSIVVLAYTNKPVPAWIRITNIFAWLIVVVGVGIGIFSCKKKT